MRIEFHIEGGFAHFPGLAKPLVIDTASLPQAEAAKLEALVREARFFTRPARVGGKPGGADYRTYSITIEDAGQSHAVQVLEPVEDPSLQALIDNLRGRQKNP